MKRATNLFPKILEWDNLRNALWRASKGKRTRKEVVRFLSNAYNRLGDLQAELIDDTFQFGSYRQFRIRDPKPRMITAPIFRERIVHHAIHRICEPAFERFLIDQTFACRKGKGRVAAIKLAQCYAKRNTWYLKLDIRGFFDSISHYRLIGLLERKFKEQALLELFWKIIDSFQVMPDHGLPIGSLTSQHFANFYLGWLDHFVKHDLHCQGYLRYMDDFVLWSGSRDLLMICREQVSEWLNENLGLKLKKLSFPQKTTSGLDFLGCQVFPGYIALNRRNRNKISRQIRILENASESDSPLNLVLQQRLTTYFDFSKQGTTVPLLWNLVGAK